MSEELDVGENTEVLLVRPDSALGGDCYLKLNKIILSQKDEVNSLKALLGPACYFIKRLRLWSSG